ncbi:hypothetical protein Tco_0470707, partial [Tanacetum coccineum]
LGLKRASTDAWTRGDFLSGIAFFTYLDTNRMVNRSETNDILTVHTLPSKYSLHSIEASREHIYHSDMRCRDNTHMTAENNNLLSSLKGRNNLKFHNEVNVQFFNNFQTEWSDFVTVVQARRSGNRTGSYSKLFDGTCTSKIDRATYTSNLLPYTSKCIYQNKGKEYPLNQILLNLTSVSEGDSDPEQGYIFNNSTNKTEDLPHQGINNLQSVKAVLESKDLGHYARECMKQSGLKDFAYHRRDDDVQQAEQGVPLQADKQADFAPDGNENFTLSEIESRSIG